MCGLPRPEGSARVRAVMSSFGAGGCKVVLATIALAATGCGARTPLDLDAPATTGAGGTGAGGAGAGGTGAGGTGGLPGCGLPGSLPGTTSWLYQTPFTGGFAFAQSILVDDFAIAWLYGETYVPVTVGPVTFAPASGSVRFVARFDAAGNVLWATPVPDPGDSPVSRAVSPEGDYLLLQQKELRRFDVSANVVSLVTLSESVGPGVVGIPFSMDVEASGDIVFGGSNAKGGDLLPIDGEALVGVADPSGKVLWTRTFGSPEGEQRVQVVQVGPDGSLWATGIFGGSIDFGDGPIAAPGGFSEQPFVVKLSPDGAVQWARTFTLEGTGGTLQQLYLAVDGQGSAVLSGLFDKSLGMGGDTLLTGSGRFLVKLDAKGDVVWAKAPSPGNWLDHQMTVLGMPGGQTVLVGTYSTPADFGGGPLSPEDGPVFFIELDPCGAPTYTEQVKAQGSPPFFLHLVASAGPKGALWLAGQLNDTSLVLGGVPISAPDGGSLFVTRWVSP